MPVSVKLFQLDGIAYASGDIQLGEAETLSPPVNTGTAILSIPLRRRRLTLNARGVVETVVSGLDSARTTSIVGLAGGNPQGETIELSPGVSVTNAMLLDFQPGAPIDVEGNKIMEQVTLIYDSVDWS